nr:hypothetical protein [Tanacetum cinerariifolium]
DLIKKAEETLSLICAERVILEDYMRKASLKCPDDGNGDNVGDDDDENGDDDENRDDDGGNVNNDVNDCDVNGDSEDVNEDDGNGDNVGDDDDENGDDDENRDDDGGNVNNDVNDCDVNGDSEDVNEGDKDPNGSNPSFGFSKISLEDFGNDSGPAEKDKAVERNTTEQGTIVEGNDDEEGEIMSTPENFTQWLEKNMDLVGELVMGAPPSPDYIPGPEAPPSPDYILGPEAPPSPDHIPGPEYPEYLPPANDMLPAEEHPLPAAVSSTAESPGYITESKPEMEPEENDGDDEKSEGDSIDHLTSKNDADDDGDDLSEDDADDKDEEESSDSEEEEEEHLAPTVPAPDQYSSVSKSDETEPFEEGETAATPPPFGYRIAGRISVQPYILMPFRTESEVERLLAIPTPPLSPVSLTSYTLPPLLTPFPIYTPLPTSSFPLPSSIPSTSGSESIPEADIPLQKRVRFTTPTSRYKIGKSSVAAAAAARQIRPTLTIAESRRADGMATIAIPQEQAPEGMYKLPPNAHTLNL